MARREGKIVAARTACAMLACAAVAEPLRAQGAPVIHDHRLFTRNDLWLLGAFTAGTVAMFPLDRRVVTRMRDSALVHNERLESAARVFGFMGSPGPFLIGGTMFIAGRLAGEPRLVQLAAHGTGALVAGSVVTATLKAVLGRARPYATADTNPGDFGFPRGFTSIAHQAFPSGHATIAFAVAAAVTSEMHGWYPSWSWVTGPVLYGGASLVGLSRMYEGKHWPSDIMMGAAIGTFAGLKVVRFTRTQTGRDLDRRLLGDDAAVRVGYAFRW